MSDSPSSVAILVSEFEIQHPGALALAETLSLAVRIEPALLREARLTLHPDVSAGAEADLWFSPLVESSSARGFVLAPEVQRELRERLKRQPDRLRKAWELLERFHAFTPTVVALEEQVTWLALSDGDAAGPWIDLLLGQAVQAMRSSPERALGIARWAMGAMQRLPVEARETEAATALNVGTLFYLGRAAEENVDLLPQKLPPSAGSGLPSEMDRVTVHLRWDAGALCFVGPDEAEGAHALQVPATTPALLSLEWTVGGKEHERLLIAEPGIRETLPEDVSHLRLTAVDGQVWELLARPSPSAFMGAGEATWGSGIWGASTWGDSIQRQWQAWEAIRNSRGEAHPDAVHALAEVIHLLRDNGALTQARTLLEQVVAALQEQHGGEHPAVLTLQNQLAEVFRAMGELKDTRRLQESGLEAAIRVWGRDHPNTLAAMGNLAMTQLAQGDMDSASRLLEQVLEKLGQDSRTTTIQSLTTLNNLAQVRREQGRLQEAREMQQRVLDGRLFHLGEEHPATLAAMNNLGLVYLEEGRYEDAKVLLEHALELQRRTVGENNLSTLTTMSNLGAVFKAQGDLARARALLEQVFMHQIRVLGRHHPDTLLTLGNLAVVFKQQGQQERAISLEEETLQQSIELFGREHARVVLAMTNLAETRRALGQFALARDGHQQALELARRALGSEHPQTLAVMNNLAGTFHAMGDEVSAKRLLEQVVEARTRLLGEAHPSTQEAMRTLARLRPQAEESAPSEKDSEEPLEPPDIDQVQAALYDDFIHNPSPELDELSSNTEIDEVEVDTLEEDPEQPSGDHYRGSGDVYITRNYGKWDDAVRATDHYPFKFTIERGSNDSIEVLSKTVDTRSFHEDVEEDEDSPPAGDEDEINTVDSYHVFLSFVQRDEKAFANRVREWARSSLLGEGVTFIQESLVHVLMGETVSDLLEQADAGLLLLGDNTHSSQSILQEVNSMLNAQKPVIVVRVPGTVGPPPEELRNHPQIAFEPQAIAQALGEARDDPF